jgi:hypothetical protein
MHKVTNRQMRELERKALAHDDYMVAIRTMRQRAQWLSAEHGDGEARARDPLLRGCFLDGYQAALTDFAAAIQGAALYRDAYAPLMVSPEDEEDAWT